MRILIGHLSKEKKYEINDKVLKRFQYNLALKIKLIMKHNLRRTAVALKVPTSRDEV